MTNTVLIKRSSSANAVPSTGNLQPGELAINYNDGNLFYKNTSNIITVIASNQFTSVAGNVTGGNLLTSGIVSATGNINGGNLSTSGLASVVGTLQSGNVLTGGNVSATGTVTGGNLLTNGNITTNGGNISAFGNVSGAYFIGNGSQLTGLPTGYANANVAAYLASGTDTSNIITTANVSGGNLLTSGIVSATGNITGNYFVGNGSQLTGVAASTVTSNAQPNITSVGVLSSLSVSGNVTSDSTVFAYGLSGNRSNVSITTGTAIDTFAASTFRGAKYLIKGGDGSDYQVSDVLLVHNDTDAFITINTVCSNVISDVFSVSASVDTGNVVLSATKISPSTTTINLVVTYVKD